MNNSPEKFDIVSWIVKSTTKELAARGYDLTNSEEILKDLDEACPHLGEKVRSYFADYAPAYHQAKNEFKVR